MERILPIIGDADVYAANNPFMAHNHIDSQRAFLIFRIFVNYKTKLKLHIL